MVKRTDSDAGLVEGEKIEVHGNIGVLGMDDGDKYRVIDVLQRHNGVKMYELESLDEKDRIVKVRKDRLDPCVRDKAYVERF